MDTILINNIDEFMQHFEDMLNKIDDVYKFAVYKFDNKFIEITKNNHWVNIIFNDIYISTSNFAEIETYISNNNSNNITVQNWSMEYPAIEIKQLDKYENINYLKIQSNKDNKLKINFFYDKEKIPAVKELIGILKNKYLILQQNKDKLKQKILSIINNNGIDTYENIQYTQSDSNNWQIKIYGDTYCTYAFNSKNKYHTLDINGFYFNSIDDLISFIGSINKDITYSIEYDQSIHQFIKIDDRSTKGTCQLYFTNTKSIKIISYESEFLNNITRQLLNNLLNYNRIQLCNPKINKYNDLKGLNICIINDFGFPTEFLHEFIKPILVDIGYKDDMFGTFTSEKIIQVINNLENNIKTIKNLQRKQEEEDELYSLTQNNVNIISNIYNTNQITELKNKLSNAVFISCGLEFGLLSISKQRIVAEFVHRIENKEYISQDNYKSITKNLNQNKDYKSLEENINKCSHEADFFITYYSDHDIPSSRYKLKQQLKRIIYLLHGYSYYSPTQDEYMMYMAFAAALRSTDLSRQVGSVITTQYGDIIATGANDIPKNGGGLYFANIDPYTNQVYDTAIGKDYMRGFDSNVIERIKIIDEITKELNLEQDKVNKLQESKLKDITEYGRVVHAEMEALMACARNNTSTRDATLYCTTFPCHNCAKHIIAAGIKRVVYIEPYPKSKAIQFHTDSIITNNIDQDNNKVRFESFNGVGPRLYLQIFQAKNNRKDKMTGEVITTWTPELIKI